MRLYIHFTVSALYLFEITFDVFWIIGLCRVYLCYQVAKAQKSFFFCFKFSFIFSPFASEVTVCEKRPESLRCVPVQVYLDEPWPINCRSFSKR